MIMRMRSAFLAALALAAAGLLLSAPAAFSQSNDDCLTCHADKELKSGSGKSLFVDGEKFAGSSHGQAEISCVDCHADLAKVRRKAAIEAPPAPAPPARKPKS